MIELNIWYKFYPDILKFILLMKKVIAKSFNHKIIERGIQPFLLKKHITSLFLTSSRIVTTRLLYFEFIIMDALCVLFEISVLMMLIVLSDLTFNCCSIHFSRWLLYYTIKLRETHWGIFLSRGSLFITFFFNFASKVQIFFMHILRIGRCGLW